MSTQLRGRTGEILDVNARGNIGVEAFDPYDLLGAFRYQLRTTVQATAQNGTTTGFVWIFNPSTGPNIVKIEKLKYLTQFEAALSAPTAPRLAAARFTYVGTPTGASGVATQYDTTAPLKTLEIRTAYTGMTVTLNPAGPFWSALPISSFGTAGWAFSVPALEVFEPNRLGLDFILRPGEGIVMYQPDAGTTADTRRLITEVCWGEYSYGG